MTSLEPLRLEEAPVEYASAIVAANTGK